MNNTTEKIEYKKGYKKTKLGWIPEDWDLVKIENIIKFSQSGLSRKLSGKDIGLPVIRSNNLINNKVDFSDIKFWYRNDNQGANTSNYFLNSKDILLNFINSMAQIGKCGLYEDRLNRDVIFTTNLMRIKLNDRILPQYFLAHTTMERYNYYIQVIAKPAVNQASFTSSDYKKYKMPLPELQEQSKIVEILNNWDEGIETLEKLIEKKQLCKKALMQKFFNQNTSIYQLEKYKLGQLFKNRKESKYNELELLSVCDGVGVVPRSQINAKNNSNEDKSKYLRVLPGDIAYNTMRMWQGRCGVSDYEGIVSPAYTICTPKDNVDVRFMYYLFQTQHMIHTFWGYSQGIVEDTLNLKYNNFSVIKVKIPDKAIQTKLANILSACDEEIELLKETLNKLTQQKKGLMQQLLTGQVRVKI